MRKALPSLKSTDEFIIIPGMDNGPGEAGGDIICKQGDHRELVSHLDFILNVMDKKVVRNLNLGLKQYSG